MSKMASFMGAFMREGPWGERTQRSKIARCARGVASPNMKFTMKAACRLFWGKFVPGRVR